MHHLRTSRTIWDEAAARHACRLWAVEQPAQLSTSVRSAMEDASNQLLISAATVWEIAIKVGLGKLSLSMPYREWMNRVIADLGATLLPITVEYAGVQA